MVDLSTRSNFSFSITLNTIEHVELIAAVLIEQPLYQRTRFVGAAFT